MTTETKHMPSEREIGVHVSFDFIAAARRNDGSAVVEAERLLREHCVPMHGHKFRMVDHDALRALTAAPDQSERVRELEAELSLANDAMQATALRAADEITALRAALAEARKVIEPFDAADNGDWRALDLLLGHSGHGQFWRETFAAFRSRLTHNPESSNAK